MKILKLFAIFFAFCNFLTFFSCSSVSKGAGKFEIPNEAKLRLENECAEYANVADAFFERKIYDKAAEYYKKALKSEKYANSVSYKLACSYALGGKYSDALPIFESLLKKNETNRSIKEALAYTTLMNGNLEKGCALYEELASENPNNAKLMRNYIKTLHANNLKNGVASNTNEKFQNQFELYIARFGKDSFTAEMQKKVSATLNNEKIESSENNVKIEENAKTPSQNNALIENKSEKTLQKNENIEKNNNISPNSSQTEITDDFDMPDWMSEFD